MKEIPMLFTTDMVSAILERRKTETRRLKALDYVNSEPNSWVFSRFETDPELVPIDGDLNDVKQYYGNFASFNDGEYLVRCPYGKAGDLIWVRETWGQTKEGEILFYASDASDSFRIDRWRPSIHLKKEDARIWLQIISIGVERLKDITEESAKAEGVENETWEWGAMAFPDGTIDKSLCGLKTTWYRDYSQSKHWSSSGAIQSYKSLWEKINGIESWDENPWVWVIKFLPDLSVTSHLTNHV